MIEIIKPSVEILTPEQEIRDMPMRLEIAGRTCYKSEDRITVGSMAKFVRMLRDNGHESVLEHANITVRYICDRACSHQIVRHRIAAYSQESQRYCDYNKKDTLEVIAPPVIGATKGIWSEGDDGCSFLHEDGWGIAAGIGMSAEVSKLYYWLDSINRSYKTYQHLKSFGIAPEDARSVLPNATKTEVVATYNIRQWRYIFKERALNRRAQWQIRELNIELLKLFYNLAPVLFQDLMDQYMEENS